MACCRRRSAAMSYRGDYRQRRLLTGHFITVTGGEESEKRERKRREGHKNRKRSKKNTIGGECRGRQRWLVVAGEGNRIIRRTNICLLGHIKIDCEKGWDSVQSGPADNTVQTQRSRGHVLSAYLCFFTCSVLMSSQNPSPTMHKTARCTLANWPLIHT